MKKTSTRHNESSGTNDPNEPTPMKAQADVYGMNYEDVKEGLRRLLPFLEMAAKLTTNKYDDLTVEFLKRVMAE